MSQSFWRGEYLTPDEALEALDGFVHAPAFDGALRAMTDEYTFRRDADVRCKVTFVFGDRDRLTLPRQLQRDHGRFPGSRAVLLKNCGHVPFWDAPAEVTNVMLQGSS